MAIKFTEKTGPKLAPPEKAEPAPRPDARKAAVEKPTRKGARKGKKTAQTEEPSLPLDEEKA